MRCHVPLYTADKMLVNEVGEEGWVMMRRMRAQRQLFVTERGWLGLGPRWAREGDEVVIRLGGSVPLVLVTEYNL